LWYAEVGNMVSHARKIGVYGPRVSESGFWDSFVLIILRVMWLVHLFPVIILQMLRPSYRQWAAMDHISFWGSIFLMAGDAAFAAMMLKEGCFRPIKANDSNKQI